MKERWLEYVKKADFAAWGQALGVSPLIARILKNRGIDTVEEADHFLHDTLEDLPDPGRFPEFSLAASVVLQAVRDGLPIAISSDFDADGIFAAMILKEGLETVGGKVFVFIPDRMKEGYGLNKRIVDDALETGAGLILTCDNGIAAMDEVAYAKEKGLKVVITDHHEVQFEDGEEGRKYLIPEADAVLDPKCPDATYPFRYLCGAGVAFRLIQLIYEKSGIPVSRSYALLDYAAIATVADVVELSGENRIIVRAGLERLRKTERVPLRALFHALGIPPAEIVAHHIGFRIAPCFNTMGRISDIREAVEFLSVKDPEEAAKKAEEIVALNDLRKALMEEGIWKAEETIRNQGMAEDCVIVAVVPDVHQSIAGIIAGKLKEKYYRPVFVLTKAEEPGLLKGSGRSIEGYHMLEALMAVKSLIVRGGGHAMAAGVTVEEAKAEAFRKALNERSELTEEELTPKIMIDARAPLAYFTPQTVQELRILEPHGVGNPRPVFARADFTVERIRPIEGKNALQLLLNDGTARRRAVYFGDPEEVLGVIRENYGEEVIGRLQRGTGPGVELAFTFVPKLDSFRGEVKVEFQCRNCCRVRKKVV